MLQVKEPTLLDKIEARQAVVGICGLGYVGLPLALTFGEKGFPVIGFDIDARKIERELGWKPAETFETGIRKTVQWYLAHGDWVQRVQSGAYREWISTQYAQPA